MRSVYNLYEGVIVPTALYGVEAWSLSISERSEFKVLEMKCLISLVLGSLMDKLGMKRCVEELE